MTANERGPESLPAWALFAVGCRTILQRVISNQVDGETSVHRLLFERAPVSSNVFGTSQDSSLLGQDRGGGASLDPSQTWCQIPSVTRGQDLDCLMLDIG